MDRNSIIALVLIFVIFLLWEPYVRFFYPPSESPVSEEQPSSEEGSNEYIEQTDAQQVSKPVVPDIQESLLPQLGTLQKTEIPEQTIEIETELYRGILTTKGGTITEWVLKNYPDPFGNPVNIIRDNDVGNLDLSFFSSEGFLIDLSEFDFIPAEDELSNRYGKIDLTGRDRPRTITLTADLGNNRYVRKRFTFDPYLYDIGFEVEFENMQTLIHNQEYTLVWGSGIRTTEKDTEDDMQFSKTMALYGSSVEKFDIQNDEERSERPFNGDIHWISTRSKYFCSLIIPHNVPGTSVEFSGKSIPEEAHIARKNYTTKLMMGFTPTTPVFTNTFSVYLGPVDFDEFKILESKIGNGLRLKEALDINSWIRELSMFIHRIFNFLHTFIPNYGIVIIVFSLLINTVMFPLTAKSYKSMKKMQDLQPLMTDLREKYKKEPKKLQQMQMKLYKEHKINPLGGCLPFLFQMPIFFAIYPIFRSIELRGAPFFGWITDLSQPDTVATIPTILPFNNLMYGNNVNVLTFVYAITMFVQQKIMMKDPKQKAMVYLMPLMLLLFLNRWSSGFILYFIIFMLLSILQRYVVKDKDAPAGKQTIPVPVEKIQAKKPRKKGKKK